MIKQNKVFLIQSAQLEQLISNSMRTIIAACFLSLLVAYIQRDVLETKLIILLVASSLIINAMRAIANQHFKRHPSKKPRVVLQRLNFFRIGVLASSIVWGLNGYYIYLTDSLEQQFFMLYILTGISAGAIISYSIDRISALIYILTSISPLLMLLSFSGGQTHVAMGVVGFIYACFAGISVIKFNSSLIESIVLKHEAEQREQEIKQIAFYDVLTSLPNRRLLQDRLQHSLIVSQRYEKGGALLFIDLDKFKLLNDTQGHEKGDTLLMQVSNRLKQSVRESDTVSRFGGDEFVVMLENLSEDINTAKEQAEKIANKIRITLSQPYALDELSYQCPASIGIAMFSEHGHTDDALLRNADTAMYQAKKSGGNTIKMFAG